MGLCGSRVSVTIKRVDGKSTSCGVLKGRGGEEDKEVS